MTDADVRKWTDEQLLERMSFECEQAPGVFVKMDVDATSALQLIGLLQMASTYPLLPASLVETASRIVHALTMRFELEPRLYRASLEIIRRGRENRGNPGGRH